MSNPHRSSVNADQDRNPLDLPLSDEAQSTEILEEPRWKAVAAKIIPYGAIVCVQLIFAANSLIVKGALEGKDFEPLLFSSFRVTIALSCMFLAAYYQNGSKFPHVPREYQPKLALLGIFGVIGNQVFNIYGLDFSNPTVQAIIQPSMAVWTMALCVLLKKESISVLKVFGLVSAIVGAVVVILYPADGDDDDSDNSDGLFVLGVIFFLCNTLSYAIYLVYQKPLLNILHPTIIGFYAFIYGAIGEVLGAIYFFFVTDFSKFDVYTWLAVLYAGFITSGLGYFLSLWAMKRTNPPLVSLASTVQPIAAAILSYFFRDESITLEQSMGGLCIVVGLGCTIYAQNRQTKSHYEEIKDDESLPNVSSTIHSPDAIQPK